MRIIGAPCSARLLANNLLPIILGLVGSLGACGQELRLDFADQARMVDCAPVSSTPCFSASFNIVDASGAPAPVELPEGRQLVSALTITANGMPAKVFYANAAASSHKAGGRVALILIDISGSMAKKLPSGETRFEAARSALLHFLDTFQDGVDQVAIAPFESHGVEETIRSVAFAHSRSEAIAQLETLSGPQAANNTALYSAVVEGVHVLNQHLHQMQTDSSSSAEALLVVMTDGRNEVLPGDDADLLKGAGGLEEAAKGVAASGIPVIGIGFGERGEIDEAALGRLSTQPPYMADDAESLKKAFTFTRRLLMDRLQVGYLSPWPDRAALAGKTITFRADLVLPDGKVVSSGEGAFETPQMGIPLYSGRASVDELGALSAATAEPVEVVWAPLLRPIIVFLGLGGLFVIAWFWIPRMVWPGQYLGRALMMRPARKWSDAASARRSSQQRDSNLPVSDAPSGFRQARGQPAARRPQDMTIAQPIGEATRLFLDKDPQR